MYAVIKNAGTVVNIVTKSTKVYTAVIFPYNAKYHVTYHDLTGEAA